MVKQGDGPNSSQCGRNNHKGPQMWPGGRKRKGLWPARERPVEVEKGKEQVLPEGPQEALISCKETRVRLPTSRTASLRVVQATPFTVFCYRLPCSYRGGLLLVPDA